jgi:hypothetical protein
VGGDGVYYSAHRSTDGKFSFDTQHNLGIEIGGEGVNVTSNNGVARNSAVQVPQSTSGQILSVRIPELNLLNIDQLAGPADKELILAAIGGDKLPLDVLDNSLDQGNLRDVIEALTRVDELKNTDYVKKVIDAYKEIGVEGFSMKSKDPNGALTADDNLHIFDPEKLLVENIEEFNARQALDGADPDVTDILQKEIEYLNSKDSHIFADPEMNKAFDEADPMPLGDEGVDNIVVGTDEALGQITALDDSNIKLPEDIDLDYNEVGKAADFCTRNN